MPNKHRRSVALPRLKTDQPHPHQRHRAAGDVPGRWPDAVDGPQPDEESEGGRGGQRQLGAVVLLEPQPGQVATDDLGERRGGLNEKGAHALTVMRRQVFLLLN